MEKKASSQAVHKSNASGSMPSAAAQRILDQLESDMRLSDKHSNQSSQQSSRAGKHSNPRSRTEK
jgi:hypothetical protein